LIAALAVKTGISPIDLLKTPPTILAAMVEELWPTTHIKKGDEAWLALASMATE
jgi:hypothetical protein